MTYIEEENLLKPRRGKTLPLRKGGTADGSGAIKVNTRYIMLMKLFIALHWPTVPGRIEAKSKGAPGELVD